MGHYKRGGQILKDGAKALWYLGGMELHITETKRGEHAFYFSGTCGNVSAHVSVYRDGAFQVVCKNAANRVWRGMGRRFESLSDAINGYKSGEMRQLIQAASQLSIS